MSRTNTTETSPKGAEKKRRYLSAEKKFQIYLEAQSTDKPVGELLRREGLYSTDLARIRQQGQGRRSPTSQRQTWAEAGPGQF